MKGRDPEKTRLTGATSLYEVVTVLKAAGEAYLCPPRQSTKNKAPGKPWNTISTKNKAPGKPRNAISTKNKELGKPRNAIMKQVLAET